MVIPYLEPPGNYNSSFERIVAFYVIPYLEPPGNYNIMGAAAQAYGVIPYLEPPGNYNLAIHYAILMLSYTIPRTTRELQQEC